MLLGRLFKVQETGLVLVIVLMGIGLTLGGGQIQRGGQAVNRFLRLENVVPNVATPISWIAIMAVGATAVIIAGGIDLSVGSIMALAALGTVAALEHMPPDASAWIVLPTALGVAGTIGLACGYLNGALVVALRMHPFIVTLGTLWLFRGIALVAIPTKSLPSIGRTIPTAFTEQFMQWQVHFGPGGVHFIQPVPMVIMLLCVAAGWVFLSHTVAGRRIYAVGGNEQAARFSGLAVGRIKLGVFGISGLTAGIAGAVSAGYNGSANTTTGQFYELIVIAAAVVGGASLTAGRGTALGALLGATVIQLIQHGIFILDLNKDYDKVINGIAIIVAVSIDRLSQSWTRRPRSRR